MRKHIIIASAIILTGCGRFLDVQPQGEIIPKTDEEFASLIHTRLRDIEGGGDGTLSATWRPSPGWRDVLMIWMPI